MNSGPGLNQLELLHWKTACQQFSVNAYGGFVLRKVYMEMGLMMLTIVRLNHLDYNVIESA